MCIFYTIYFPLIFNSLFINKKGYKHHNNNIKIEFSIIFPKDIVIIYEKTQNS